MKHWAGIDLGSISLKLAVIDEAGTLLSSVYTRTEGRPLAALLDVLSSASTNFSEFEGIVATGSGRELLAEILGAQPKNEILTQARGAVALTPDVRTIIEIGGQDSKLIAVSLDPKTERGTVVDHSLNEVCAAGTGSFLDQQASRLGISIEELGLLAMDSEQPAFVAGRCAVFAKSDLMHLQQAGVKRSDILAGLCMALARNFLSSVGKGRKLQPPINFQGGVAANPAVVRAFEAVLELPEGSFRVPPRFKVIGALGAALTARDMTFSHPFNLPKIMARIEKQRTSGRCTPIGPALGQNDLPVLTSRNKSQATIGESSRSLRESGKDGYLGVDVGAASVKLVVIDADGKPITSHYAITQGDPLQSIRTLLISLEKELGDGFRVHSVGVTGSGRNFISALIGGDVVLNEISAQARAALWIDPHVDTLIEIGGQDSKFVRFENGTVVNFEMNKACAAGTGSFLEEQAARLGIQIEDEFSKIAFASKKPADLGTRCTVFMESDLIHHQQSGKQVQDLVAGLAYGIVLNYLENVVGSHPLGENIHFQGGVASNESVVAALENQLGKKVTVSPFHKVTGAWGAALYAQEKWQETQATRFQGFDLDLQQTELSFFNCQSCANVCRITRRSLGDAKPIHFGGICDRYDSTEKQANFRSTPDLLEKRQELMMVQAQIETPATQNKPAIGIPRALFFFDHFPLWSTFLQQLGYPVVLSAVTNHDLYYRGLCLTQSDSCLPVKMLYGHVLDLIDQGIDTVFLPNEIELPHESDDLKRSYNCPYMQGSPYMMRATFLDHIRWITPDVYMAGSRENLLAAMVETAGYLGVSKKQAKLAAQSACRAQAEFRSKLKEAGRTSLEELGGKRAVILLGKPHHLFDEGQNMHLAKKLRKLGITAIPYDFLPLSEVKLPDVFENVVWKNSHDLMRAAVLAKELGLPTIMLSNFGCGPDSFALQYLDEILAGHPHLVIEVDDHTSDAGLLTRLEAFLDTLKIPARSDLPEPGAELETLTSSGKTSQIRMMPSPELRRLLDGRTLYFPYVNPGMSEILKAAIRASGIETEILPEPDGRTEELGKKYALGSECHPFIVTLGDFAKLTDLPNFDPSKSAFAMFNYDGACRLSQYTLGHKLALTKRGFGSIPVIGPILSTRRDEFSKLFGLRCTMAMWKGWLAAEVLERQMLAIRPYEKTPGSTEATYLEGVRRIADVLTRSPELLPSAETMLLKTVNEEVNKIKALPVGTRNGRPKIGVLGEFYTALSPWANDDLFKQLEDLGAEVKTHGIATTNFLLLFAEHYHTQEMRRKRRPLSAAFYSLRRHWMVRWADALEGLLDETSGDIRLLHSDRIMHDIYDYIHSDIDPVSTTFVARYLDFARKGVSGINYIMVLNCMLSNMTLPIFRHISAQNQNLPLLATPYDGLKPTNTRTRLEAFVEQAQGFQERYLR